LLTSSVLAIPADALRRFGLLILAKHRIAVSESIDLSPDFFDIRMICCIAALKLGVTGQRGVAIGYCVGNLLLRVRFELIQVILL
jgi:hypothetical protein